MPHNVLEVYKSDLLVRKWAIMKYLPLGNRTEIVLWPGNQHVIRLCWVEVDDMWHCYTELLLSNGLHEVAEIVEFGRVHFIAVQSLIMDIYLESEEMTIDERIAYKALIQSKSVI